MRDCFGERGTLSREVQHDAVAEYAFRSDAAPPQLPRRSQSTV